MLEKWKGKKQMAIIKITINELFERRPKVYSVLIINFRHKIYKNPRKS